MDTNYGPGIQVIVVNYKTSWDVKEFLDSFYEFPPTTPCDMTVFNVSPTEADTKVAKDYPNICLLEEDENIGYGRAVNRAAKESKREVLAIFNADVVLTEGAMDRCYGALMAREDVGVLGPRQVDQDGLLTHVGIFGTNEKPHFRGGWHQPASTGFGFTDTRDDAISVAGSAMFVRRSVWDELVDCPAQQAWLRSVGSPQPDGAMGSFPLYYEDMWLSVHSRAHGYKVQFLGSCTICHKWHRAVIAEGLGEPTDKYVQSRDMYRAVCDAHGISHE